MYQFEDNESRIRQIQSHKPVIQNKITSNGLSIIILNLDKPELIGPLLESLINCKNIFEQKGHGLDIFVGDTGSTDPRTLEIYKIFDRQVKIVTGLKYHFSKNNNQLCNLSRYSHLLFLNNDVIFPSPNVVLDIYNRYMEA